MVFKSRDITINTTTIDDGKYSIDIDFSILSEVLANDSFELNIDDIAVKLPALSEMSVSDLIELVERNCNANFDFNDKAIATSSTNILNITTKDANSIEISLDYHKEH